MRPWPTALAVLVGVIAGFTTVSSRASVHDYAVEVRATVQESPPQIDFAWPADPSAERYYVFRKSVADTIWGDALALLPGSATSFSDSDVEIGCTYEYAFEKNLGVYRDTLLVPDGTPVTFTIRDTWGDGICCSHGHGVYEVTGCGLTYASGGEFGSEEVTSFVTGGVGGQGGGGDLIRTGGADPPDDPCEELVVSVTLDVYGQETTWTLVEDASGEIIGTGGPYEPPRYGHIVAGIRRPASEWQGITLVLVEESVAPGLTMELERLRCDLLGDGYIPRFRTVGHDWSVPAVKELILEECAADSAVTTLLLIGHVPVPYSGDVWSGHPEHCGAWPADVYYAELDGEWTDEYVYNVSGARPENHNVPGDGKFDQTFLPSDADLQLGRVDLSRLTAFALSETELLRRYLEKNHAFRVGEIHAEERGLIDDNVGDAYGLAPATTGWRNFATMFGEHVHAGDFFPDLETQSHLWAYGCGGSGYTYCGGVGSTQQFATSTVLVVFTSLFGSYFGDWDNTNNVLRAPLAAAGYPLCCFWSGRPMWHFQHMSLGFPLGYGARLTQNNRTLYRTSDGIRGIQAALMGDPTLRLHAVRPATELRLESLGEDGIRLRWHASADEVLGYHVYRTATVATRPQRLTDVPVADSVFVDAYPLPENNVYFVRAIALQETSGGSYYNLSCATIDSMRVAAVEERSGAARGLTVDPCPLTGTARISLHLAEPASVEVAIFDARGAVVCELARGSLSAGAHILSWDGTAGDGRRVASGVYFLRLATEGREQGRTLVVLR